MIINKKELKELVGHIKERNNLNLCRLREVKRAWRFRQKLIKNNKLVEKPWKGMKVWKKSRNIPKSYFRNRQDYYQHKYYFQEMDYYSGLIALINNNHIIPLRKKLRLKSDYQYNGMLFRLHKGDYYEFKNSKFYPIKVEFEYAIMDCSYFNCYTKNNIRL